MASINDTPQGSTLFPEGLVNMSMERRQQVILQAAQVIAESFVDINFSKKDSLLSLPRAKVEMPPQLLQAFL